jgi:bifunctional non-homologous end joining protein LigD
MEWSRRRRALAITALATRLMASRKLSKYRAKRDFSRTAEPAGSGAVARSGQLRFVIQKHAARRLHYDLRLELGGVFKSWAVTRGPSLDPADKRLAVEVEDHPLEYGDFEGTIPQGQYGGGTVMIWDRGYWQPESPRGAARALEDGELKLVLAGERLRGGWVLIRLRNSRSGKRPSWLLIKHRDEFARAGGNGLLEEDRSVASGRSLGEITAGAAPGPTPFMAPGRDQGRADAVWSSSAGDGAPRAAARRSTGAARLALRGRSVRGGNRGRMPRFIEPQLCRLLQRPPVEEGWAHEIKLDGYRLQLRVEGGRATLMTRKGLDWTDRFSSIARAAQALPDCLMDGEAVALDANGVSDFPALQSALAQGAESALVLFLFDLMYLEGRDLRALPLSERKRRLQRVLEAAPSASRSRLRYLEHFTTPGDAVLESACRLSLEGVVSKRLDAPYRSGRNGEWTKSKCRAGQEVVLAGWTSEGERLSSLIAGVYRGGRLVPAGRIGTGFGERERVQLMPRLAATASDHSPFEQRVSLPAGRQVHWLEPRLVAEIEFAGWTEGGNVRQAAFKGLREDKPAREVRFEAPAPLASAAYGRRAASAARAAPPATRAGRKPARGSLGSRKSASGSASARHPSRRAGSGRERNRAVLGVSLTHPDKVMWPDAGDGRPVTKAELAEYLVAIGEWLLPHLEGRPCSIIRAPDGIAGQHFFQRHAMAGMSHLIDQVKVAGESKPYLEIDRVEGLAAAAQIAALELHPWNCRPHEPEVPGRLVFDLDPAPDVGFGQVIRGARELRERLEALGLESFPKTTGGKGLHVVVPFTQPRTGTLAWPLVKAFARELCARLASDSPQRYVINMAKRVRTGRIFLDYLRNDRTATAVAPLSPRARPGAPVSMPLTWAQLRTGLDPTRFTVRTVPAMMARADAWAGYSRAARPLAGAIERLAGTGRSGTPSGARAPRARRRVR